jgi:hypothetical protein
VVRIKDDRLRVSENTALGRIWGPRSGDYEDYLRSFGM